MKTGEKVIVREDLKIGEKYGMCTFSEDMEQYLGKEGIIRNIKKGYFYLLIDEIEVEKKFTEEMIREEGTNVELIDEDIVQAVVYGIEQEAIERNALEEQVINEIKDEMNNGPQMLDNIKIPNVLEEQMIEKPQTIKKTKKVSK